MSESTSGSSMVRFSASRADWVERLFARLAANYGTLFTSRFDGFVLADVRDEWARQLDGMPAYRIGYALDHLPNLPPTLPEFKALCNLAPAQAMSVAEAVPTLPRESERVLSLEERRQKIADMKALVGKWKA